MNTTIRLWWFWYEYSAGILSPLTTGRFDLQGVSSYEFVMPFTPYIPEYVSYTWFQLCWYFNESSKSKLLCCWLVSTHQVGQAFCSYIILDNAPHISWLSYIAIQQDALLSDHMKDKTKNFITSLESLIGNYR